MFNIALLYKPSAILSKFSSKPEDNSVMYPLNPHGDIFTDGSIW